VQPQPTFSDEASGLLQQLNAGNTDAGEKFYALVYRELKNLAHRQLRHERASSLQTTALVHEACLRLLPRKDLEWGGRSHFLQVAAGTMRTILVDHARRRRAQKRGCEPQRVVLDSVLAAYEEKSLDLLEVDEAITRLQQIDEQMAGILVLRFYGGLTIAETAAVLKISHATVERGWKSAKAWMRVELEKE
jgi:RNA polymerase sigma factor (TIGR02999 family)